MGRNWVLRMYHRGWEEKEMLSQEHFCNNPTVMSTTKSTFTITSLTELTKDSYVINSPHSNCVQKRQETPLLWWGLMWMFENHGFHWKIVPKKLRLDHHQFQVCVCALWLHRGEHGLMILSSFYVWLQVLSFTAQPLTSLPGRGKRHKDCTNKTKPPDWRDPSSDQIYRL